MARAVRRGSGPPRINHVKKSGMNDISEGMCTPLSDIGTSQCSQGGRGTLVQGQLTVAALSSVPSLQSRLFFLLQ